jgi:hypothetical protein
VEPSPLLTVAVLPVGLVFAFLLKNPVRPVFVEAVVVPGPVDNGPCERVS